MLRAKAMLSKLRKEGLTVREARADTPNYLQKMVNNNS